MVRHDVYGPKTDVWSWGVLLHELLTQSVPYSSCRLGPAQVALAVADDQLRPAWGPQAGRPPLPADVAVLGRLATAADPDSRPTFAFIVEELGAIIRKLQRGQPQQAGAPAAAAAAAAAQQPAGDPVATPSGGASWQRVLGKAASSARLP